jgi:hypothetical protein
MNPVPDPASDTPALVAARQLEIDTLNAWVRDFHAERRAAKAFMREAAERAEAAAARGRRGADVGGGGGVAVP